MGDIYMTPQDQLGLQQAMNANRRSKMTLEELLALNKNPQLASIYSDIQGAQNGPDLYSQNDIRNNSLAIQTGAAPGWRDFLKTSAGGAEQAGMADSGFYGDYLNRAGAQQNAQTQGQIMSAANQFGQANQQYRQQKMSDSMGFLSMFLQGQRKRHYGATQLANAYGIGGG